jgi:hypothetical protein
VKRLLEPLWSANALTRCVPRVPAPSRGPFGELAARRCSKTPRSVLDGPVPMTVIAPNALTDRSRQGGKSPKRRHTPRGLILTEGLILFNSGHCLSLGAKGALRRSECLTVCQTRQVARAGIRSVAIGLTGTRGEIRN